MSSSSAASDESFSGSGFSGDSSSGGLEMGTSLYTSDAVAVNPPQLYTEKVDYPGPSIYYLLDLPPLLSSHTEGGIYICSGARFDAWDGCAIYYSKDEGDSYLRLREIVQRALTGSLMSPAPGDFASNGFDNLNYITIRWDKPGDALSSVTKTQWLNGNGHFLLVGTEIICAKDVTTNEDGTQTFGPPLIRGAKGTEYAMTGHKAGEKVIRLNTSTIFFQPLDTDFLGQSYLFKALSYREEWEHGIYRVFPTTFRNLKPWAGVNARGTRDGSNNLTITWNRRNRFSHLNPLRTGIEVPMSESTESYEVDIIDPDSAAEIVRTINSLTSESASYTAAQQTADGYTPGDPIDCVIYQLSATVGRGWPLAATV